MLEHILLGRLFVDEDNRDTNYDDMLDGDIFKELHDELKKTSYIKQLLLGDISPEKYRKLIDQIKKRNPIILQSDIGFFFYFLTK